MAGSGDGLANGGKVGLGAGDSSSGNGELGYGVEGSGVLPSAVKFTLEIKLDYFHIAQGHADVLVSEHLHERRQAIITPRRTIPVAKEWRSRCGWTRPVQPASRAISAKVWCSTVYQVVGWR